MPINDNDSAMRSAIPVPADPHGKAALLLVESLVHGLCENATLSADEAVEIAERAVNVQSEQAEAANDETPPLMKPHALLSAIAASLRIEANGKPTPPRLMT